MWTLWWLSIVARDKTTAVVVAIDKIIKKKMRLKINNFVQCLTKLTLPGLAVTIELYGRTTSKIRRRSSCRF